MMTVAGAVPLADAGLQPQCSDAATSRFCISPSVSGYCSGDNWVTSYSQCNRPNCWCESD